MNYFYVKTILSKASVQYIDIKIIILKEYKKITTYSYWDFFQEVFVHKVCENIVILTLMNRKKNV